MVTIIEISLYVLKSSGAAWREKPAKKLMLLGYKSSDTDADV